MHLSCIRSVKEIDALKLMLEGMKTSIEKFCQCQCSEDTDTTIQWSENFRTFDVPSFTCPSGPSLSYRSWIYLHSWCLQAAIVNAYILYMATNSEPKPKKFSQSDFRIILGKQLINGFSCRKVKPSYDPVYVGPDVTTNEILDHENSRLKSSRGQNCRFHKSRYGCSKRTVFGCNTCQVYLCKECHYPWHNSTNNN